MFPLEGKNPNPCNQIMKEAFLTRQKMNFAPAERLRGLALGGLHWWHCDGLVDDCPGVTATMLRCFEAVRQGVEIEGYPPGIQGGVLTNLLRKILKIPSFELISDIQQKVQLPTPCVLGF